jgi:DNA-directed RNA polymerase specialized sigma24 family protein
MSDAWWATELMRLQPSLIAHVRRQLSREPFLAADLVGGIAVELTARFQSGSNYPASWFESDVPSSPADRAGFRHLVRRIATRRVHDRLRSHYRRLASEQLLPSPNAPATPEEDFDVRALVTALQHRLDSLDPTERELLLQDVHERGRALTGAERTQLVRLRSRLVEWLKKDLGKC